jgi:tetratricopeptide (TPR) repeat protein
LHQAGRLAEADALYQKIRPSDPDYAESLHLRGVIAYQRNHAAMAATLIGQAIARAPGHAAYHSNLGLALVALGRLAEARACYNDAVALNPNFAEAWCNLGAVLGKLAQTEAAAAAYARARALKPHQPEIHFNLAGLLADQGRLQEAVGHYQNALAVRPDYFEAHNNLGVALGQIGRWAEAIGCYRRAVALRPDHPNAHNNLGAALAEQGCADDAIACYRAALAANPTHAEAHYNLARALLARGDMDAGWKAFEWRWKTRQLQAAHRRFPQPQWRGEAGAGRTLLIHAEQGFGDTLQFCRYAPLAAQRGLRVVLEVPAPLLRLLRGLPGMDAVIATGETLPAFDLHCPMLSLPLAFGTQLHSIPAAAGYVRAEPNAVAHWARRLHGDDLRVGLVWAGNPRADVPALAAIDRRRSLDPALLAPLFATSGVTFFSLQKTCPAPPTHLPLIDHMQEMADFADTAALIMQLDLVIAVDTAVAHLAAGLGKPVWLLNRFDSCWRWLTDRRDSPWYETLHIYQQSQPGDWVPVIAHIARDLRSITCGHLGRNPVTRPPPIPAGGVCAPSAASAMAE